MDTKISEKIKRGVELFEQGYNCSQSVVLAFAEDFGIDPLTALKFSSSFGGGMGRLREVCGAVTGAFMVLGWCYPATDITDKGAKKENYAAVQNFAMEFKGQMGSYICAELLKLKREPQTPIPSERSREYYSLRPCSRCVAAACEILAKEVHKSV